MLTWMTTSAPWGALPAELADVLEPELPAIADEILRAIGEEVREYSRPLEGAFGRGVRTGVTQALERFLALVREPGGTDPRLSRVYVALGRAELRAGRTLDALQSAYRIGARVAWRRIARVTADAGFELDVVSRLAEAIFAYIDELSAESVEGYTRAHSELAGERERLRNQLVQALLHGAPTAEVAALAEQLEWAIPRGAAALACTASSVAALVGRLGPGVVATIVEGKGCVVLPDAEGPGGAARIRAALRDQRAALGPELPLAKMADSWRLAVAALGLAPHTPGLLVADDRLGELLLVEGAAVVERILLRRLDGLESLTPKARARAIETALAYIQHRGNAVAIAGALQIHPQTARYRINGLRELLGGQLDEPDARFEIEAALRAL
jgi:hypothetical protein